MNSTRPLNVQGSIHRQRSQSADERLDQKLPLDRPVDPFTAPIAIGSLSHFWHSASIFGPISLFFVANENIHDTAVVRLRRGKGIGHLLAQLVAIRGHPITWG